MRLIDADELIEKVKLQRQIDRQKCGVGYVGTLYNVKNVIDLLNEVETIDAVKHGHWIFVEDMVSYIKCSECGDDICWVNTKRPKYCPSCSAKMDGDNDAD